MRFLRIGAAGAERPAVLDSSDRCFDLSTVADAVGAGDLDPGFFAADGPHQADGALRRGELTRLDIAGERIGPPLAAPGKLLCIGLNYSDHAAETGASPPDEPVLFMKTADTVVGPNDSVLIPRGSAKTDYEVELAVVLGSTARYLDSPAEAAEHIAGYAIANDVSERAFQLERGGQWDKGKSCETFNPLGPWLVAPDELSDPQNLDMRLWVNGELRQHGNTRNMLFSVHYVVWYLSQFLVLRPGDVINTGTPAGVAIGAGWPYLEAGDVVELEIDQLGRQRQVLKQA